MNRVLIAFAVGGTAALLVGALQGAVALQGIKTQGLTLKAPPLPPIHLEAGKGKSPVELPPVSAAALETLPHHVVIVGLGAALIAFLAAK